MCPPTTNLEITHTTSSGFLFLNFWGRSIGYNLWSDKTTYGFWCKFSFEFIHIHPKVGDFIQISRICRDLFGCVCRTETMHRLLCFKSRFPKHFVFTLGRYLFLLFLSNLFNVNVNYNLCMYVYIYIERELTIVISALVNS